MNIILVFELKMLLQQQGGPFPARHEQPVPEQPPPAKERSALDGTLLPFPAHAHNSSSRQCGTLPSSCLTLPQERTKQSPPRQATLPQKVWPSMHGMRLPFKIALEVLRTGSMQV